MDAQIDRDLERPYIVETKELTKKFGEEVAVNHINMDIPDGSIFGLIGPSGCGKTTTIRLMTGVHQPTSGEVKVLGKSPADFTSADREKIGYQLQQFVLYPDLSVWENLNFAASFYGVGYARGKRLKQLLDFVELSEHKSKISRELSGGMNRRLSLAATLVHNPRLLFLDEPTAGIDPILRVKFWDYFREIQKQGRSLIVTTQYVGEAEYCDLVGVMSAGRLLLVDSPEGLRRRAFGGEIVRIVTQERVEYLHRLHVEKLPFTKGKVQVIDDNEVEVIVDDADTAIPPLIDTLRADGLNVLQTEKKIPLFDEVFVRVIEEDRRRTRENQAEEEERGQHEKIG